MIRAFLIAVFGFLPGALLAFLALFVFLSGIGATMERSSVGVLLVVWSLLGFYGIATMVLAALRKRSSRVVLGLVAGILAAAIVPLVPLLLGAADGFLSYALLVAGPIATAGYLLKEQKSDCEPII